MTAVAINDQQLYQGSDNRYAPLHVSAHVVGGARAARCGNASTPPPLLQLDSEHWQQPGFDAPAAHRADGQHRCVLQSQRMDWMLLVILTAILLHAGETASATVPGMYSQTLPGVEFGPAAPPSAEQL